MGFRRNIGATRPCRVNNGFLEVQDSTLSYRTTIPINTDWQCNLYRGTNVSFLLITEDAVYVGTQIGSVGKYSHDGLFLAMYTWEAPQDPTILVGYNNDAGVIKEAWIFENEPSVIHLRGSRKSYYLNAGLVPVERDADDLLSSYTLSSAVNKTTGLHVELRGGGMVDELEQGHWRADPKLSTVYALQF